MLYHSQGRLGRKVDLIRRRAGEAQGLPFADLLDPQRVRRVIEQEGAVIRACTWSLTLTVYTFLSQVLSADRSCRQAVARVVGWLTAKGREPCSPTTGPYCKARARIPERVLVRLAKQVANELHQRTNTNLSLAGRPVKMVDGATVSMPDTPENQREYPQPNTQKPGLGFPVTRLVALISLSCGAVLDLAQGPYTGKRTGEGALFRSMFDSLDPGDIVLGDRSFCSFWHMAMLLGRGVDSVFRLHQRRTCDFRRGRRLGKYDHVVQWRKPSQPPEWMDWATYYQLPDSIAVREVKVTVNTPGFRVKTLMVTTTLTDSDSVTSDDLADAYRARWHAELDLRSIKSTMEMDVLRCKSPSMVRKEMWTHLLAYNLIRTVMADAAETHQISPRQVSFAGAMQTLRAFRDMVVLATCDDWPRLYRAMLQAIAHHRVGDRPNRCEPRAIKRRPKPHALLTVPRRAARCRVAQRT